MNLPKIIEELVNAQDSFDSVAYANCFSETAVVNDEGKTLIGKTEIEQWIVAANKNYKTVMHPLSYSQTGTSGVLSAKVSGTFDGSPLVLNYHVEIADGLILSLRVTG